MGHHYLPEKVYGEDGACIRCGVMPMLQSFGGDARKVLLQLLHTANREAGLLPPMQEVARLLGWPLARADAAFEELVKREVVAPLAEGLEADFPGQYMAVWASHTDAMARMERRAALAEQSVLSFEDQREVERDLRAKIVELEQKTSIRDVNRKALDKARRRIKELEHAMESLQQMLEREKSMPVREV